MDADGSLEPPRGLYDTLPRGQAFVPSDYVSMPTVTLLQGIDIWPLPDDLVELVLMHLNSSLEAYPHNLTYQEAYVRPRILLSYACGMPCAAVLLVQGA